MKQTAFSLALVALFLLAGVALAISSPNYRLDWFTPLTGGGGGAVSSAHHGGSFTIGQSAIGASTSTNYGSCLGYWCGQFEYRVLLPLVLRDYS